MSATSHSGRMLVAMALTCAVAAAVLPSSAVAQEVRRGIGVRGGALVEALSKGGYVIYMRHTKTERRQKDRDHLGDLSDCSNQRNLSAAGRKQARDIGQSFNVLGIEVGGVLSSPYCRAYDTAQIAFGKGKKHDNLRYLTFQPPEQAKESTKWLRRQLATVPPRGKNNVLIAHTANLKDGLGLWPKNAGDIFVFRPTGSDFIFVGKIAPDEWYDLSGLSRQAGVTTE